MKTIATLAAAVVALAGTAQAADPAAGQRVFAQRCATCHMVVSPAGETIVKGGKTGPNQWGLVGRTAGSVADFRQYGPSLVNAGKAGLVWSEAEIVAYLEDPREYLRARTGDAGAQSKMAFKLRDEGERANVAAYLATFK